MKLHAERCMDGFNIKKITGREEINQTFMHLNVLNLKTKVKLFNEMKNLNKCPIVDIRKTVIMFSRVVFLLWL